ncbi:hypothetical protein HCN44_005755 [Aphidius gifuensis]|uniref:WD repeat-containing protein 55 homolog n=1 Tax=Aphidius gifuensis TaxID=684658 RepID=A0A835CRL9_APHGI|nr:U3 small nucleolar RNA-associated protein 4 homolog [Aphidius gifuensis]KAF7992974.1 hypothetical protein HCN44_005755 [Aphidius gifuensis]
MTSCKVHNVRFYNLAPRAITNLCYEKNSKKLALSRDDCSIEIWNVTNVPFLESTIPGNDDDESIESLVWIDSKRLLSCGTDGMIIEYDLKKLKLKYKVAVTGGQAWCMDINPDKTRIAVGTEGGYINTFTVNDDSLIYEKIFDKQKGRILCLKWDKTGEMIFTGSTDTVRVWNAISGHAIHKMLTSREQTKKETIVWCLGVTADNHIASGDSRGVLSLWNPITGFLIESHESHIADILALAVSDDSNVIYSAGVDPVVRSFSRVVLKSSDRPQWVKGIERRLHVHDVRALLEYDGKLYSAGVDGYLAQSSYPPKMLIKYPPLLSTPCVTVCRKSRCVMLRYIDSLELWRLGSPNTSISLKPGSLYQLDEEPMKLLKIETKRGESILSYAITKDSKIIVYSTDTHVRVFNFDVIDGVGSLSKNDNDITLDRIQNMIFSPNNKLFIAINNNGNDNEINIFKVEKKIFKAEGKFITSEHKIDNIALMCFSPDNKYFICADRIGNIVVYIINDNFINGKPEFWQLPKYSCSPTAIAVQNLTLNMVVVYSDHKVIEYNLLKRQYTDFSNQLQHRIPTQWLSRPFPITNVTFDPNNDNIIIVHDDTTVYVINKNNDFSERLTKISKFGAADDDSNSASSFNGQHNFQIVKKYKHLVHLESLNSGEMVAVEVNPITLTEKLPPSLKYKSFGTS